MSGRATFISDLLQPKDQVCKSTQTRCISGLYTFCCLEQSDWPVYYSNGTVIEGPRIRVVQYSMGTSLKSPEINESGHVVNVNVQKPVYIIYNMTASNTVYNSKVNLYASLWAKLPGGTKIRVEP